MLIGKQKRFLQSLGMKLEPVVQIGKNGVAAPVVASAQEALTARELIKVRVLRNCPDTPQAAIAQLAAATEAELVQVIGRNGLLYKPNLKKPQIVLPD